MMNQATAHRWAEVTTEDAEDRKELITSPASNQLFYLRSSTTVTPEPPSLGPPKR